MKWLERKFRQRRPKRMSKLEQQVRLGRLQDAMGRAEQRVHGSDGVGHNGERLARLCPPGASVVTWPGASLN